MTNTHLYSAEKNRNTERQSTVFTKTYDEGEQTMIDTNEFVTLEKPEGLTLTKYTGNSENVVIPDGIVIIGREAFSECKNIKTVTIPSSVKTISEKAFMNIESLEEVVFSEGLEIIENRAFFGCKKLRKADLPNSLKRMDFAVFYFCEKLEKIEFGKKLKRLEANITHRCNSIQKMVIPEHIQKVDDVNGMNGLTSLIIESDLPKNKKVYIIDCENLTEIVFKKGFANLKGINVVCCPKAEYVTVGDKTYPVVVKNRVGTLVLEEDKPTIPFSNEPVDFAYNEENEQFECDFKGIIFAIDHEPDENDKNNVRLFAQNYAARLDKIVKFMLPDLKEVYGKVTAKDVKAKLGKPTINLSRYTVTYLEQAFDGDHIFEFEFMDDEFDDLENFVIDG